MTQYYVCKVIAMILMLAGIVGYSIYHVKRCDKYRKSISPGYSDEDLEFRKAYDIIICGIGIVLLFLMFFVGFWQLTFFSNTKFVSMVIFLFGWLISQLGYYKTGSDMFAVGDYSLKYRFFIFVCAAGMLIRLLIIVSVVSYTVLGGYGHYFGKIVSQSEEVDYIYPEAFGKTKIAKIKDTSQYSFITNEEGVMTRNTLVFGEEDITEGGETYIQVSITYKNGIDNDRRKEDPERRYVEEYKTYHLFLNKNDMIELSVVE